jgi:hypothetical protein
MAQAIKPAPTAVFMYFISEGIKVNDIKSDSHKSSATRENF